MIPRIDLLKPFFLLQMEKELRSLQELVERARCELSDLRQSLFVSLELLRSGLYSESGASADRSDAGAASDPVAVAEDWSPSECV